MGVTAVTETTALSPREFLGIFKLRIALSITLSAVAGLAITPGTIPAAPQVVLLALSVFLAAGAAGAFNQWAEADLDALMARTAGRPFASGRIAASWTWFLGITALLAVACTLAAFAANLWSSLYTFLGAFTYAVIYTLWLKRRTWLNIVIGGLAGSFAVLAGAAAVDPRLPAEPVLLAIVLFLWTPPHFWSLAIAAHADYKANVVPMLPVIIGDRACARVILAHAIALSLVALIPTLYGRGAVYLVFAVTGGVLFVATSLILVAEPTKKRAIHNFLASLAQLALLLIGTILDRWVLGGFG